MSQASRTEDLHNRLMSAHDARDLSLLSELYTEAAGLAENEGDIDRCCFFLTQAWVFAMDAGDPKAIPLKARLVAYGRDVDQIRSNGEQL